MNMINMRKKRILSFLLALFLLLSNSGEAAGAALAWGGWFQRTVTFTASDGNDWQISVRCGEDAGIPETAELSVTEIPADDSGYAGYAARSAELLGETVENLPYVRAFDIKLRDPETGETYQPGRDVQVRIELLRDDLSLYPDVHVVHIPDGDEADYDGSDGDGGDGPDGAEVLDSSVLGNAVSFRTDGFSVYVVTGTDAVPRLTFRFYVWDGETGSYKELGLASASGSLAYTQTIKAGEKPLVPQLGVDNFLGWYEGTIPDGEVVLADAPYDFEHISFTESNEVNLYAVTREYVTATFHDQYDTASGTFPVAYTRRAELVQPEGGDGSSPASATVNIDLTAPYSGSAGGSMAFYGWSRTPITVPGAARDDNGQAVQKVAPDGNGNITAAADLDLYPIYKPVYWLTYYTAQAGLSASYVPPVSCFVETGTEAAGPAGTLPVPSRAGYTFEGWYLAALNSETVTDGDGGGELVETVVFDENAIQVTNELGQIRVDLDNPSVRYSTGGGGTLYLRKDTTLYAKWRASYNVVLWRQRTADGPDLADGDKTYEYVRTLQFPAEIGDTVSVAEEYKSYSGTGDFAGWTYSRCDADKEIQNTKEITTLNVYYDLSGPYTASGSTHRITFVDSETGQPSPMPADETDIEYGAALKDHKPSNPVSVRKSESGKDVYTFAGWFFDSGCTIPADLSSKSTLTMPDHDLTLYAGWTGIKYRVQIDPNYGALYTLDENGKPENGTGATWFNNTYLDEPIGEYTHVTRDYVESSSGEWYYAKHDLAYYGIGPQGDRKTYYTRNFDEASEDTTFEYAPGVYSYAGWYEVVDGVEAETPYDFSQRTDHATTLRLHWKKNGTFRVSFAAGEGTMDSGGKTALSGDRYSDNASVVLTHAANAPTGHTFVGWKVRGDESGRVYAPGQLFTLHADDARLISGQEIVYLDAVYARVSMAQIVYDANGGTVDPDPEAVDYGRAKNADSAAVSAVIDGKPALTSLNNNASVYLSDGTGFTRENAEFAGWSDKPVCDSGAKFYEPGGEYGVDTREPVTLYAVWRVTAAFHLNRDDAAWGETPWDEDVYTYDAEDKTYTRDVYLGTTIEEPENVPEIVDGDGSNRFCYWVSPQDSDTAFDFSQPIAETMDFYAYWSGPIEIPVHAVDASREELADRDADWLPSGGTTLSVAANVPLTAERARGLMNGEFEEQAVSEDNPDGTYQFAFAAAHKIADGVANITERDKINSVYYNTAKKHIYARFADGRDEALNEGVDEIYFVYYEKKELNIGHKIVNYNGTLAPVSVSGDAPLATGTRLGEYSMAEELPSPLDWPEENSYARYAYAVGESGATLAAQFHLITETASAGDTPPALTVRNTWRGFQFSTDGTDWDSCGYNPQLYVLYFERQPTLIHISETTVGTRAQVRADAFQYTVEIREYRDGEAVYGPEYPHTFTLRSGEAHTVTANYWISEENGVPAVHRQEVTVTQTAADGYTTTVDGEEALVWTYTTTDDDEPQTVTFTNTREEYPIEVHVALVEENGIVLRDNLRTDDAEAYSLTLRRGGSAALGDRGETPVLPSSPLFAGDETHTLDDYAFGAVMYGTGSTEGGAITPASLDAASVTYGHPAEEPDNIYELLLKDEAGNTLGELGVRDIYYLYYPMPRIQYVKEDADGTLTKITGSLDGTDIAENTITYNREPVTMNQQTVVQDQSFRIPREGFVISQQGRSSLRMPPVLDDGIYEHYLAYTRLGAGNAGVTNAANLSAVSDGLAMYLRVDNNALQYSFDASAWDNLPLSGIPTIYAVYTERGFNLQITKEVSVPAGFTGDKAFFTGHTFPVTVTSPAITKTSYEAEGADAATVSATPASGSTPGSIALTVFDGAKITLRGLGQGDYTITEGGLENFLLTAAAGPIVGGAATAAEVQDNSTLSLRLDTEKKVELTNSPTPLCKITVDGTEHIFYSLTSALDYVDREIADDTASIQMLTDYRMPAADALTIPEGFDITLTTAGDGEAQYGGESGTAVIRRSAAMTDVPMFTNAGTLRLENIIIDGESLEASAPMIESAGDLILDQGASLTNGKSTGNGGAIHATGGDITVASGSIERNSAARGGAIYYAGIGTVSLPAAQIQYNSASADGGAVYAESGSFRVSGTSSLYRNEAKSGRGGAVYAKSAVVAVEGNGRITGNEAQSGGAVYVESGTITISVTEADAAPTLKENTASTGNGGAVWLGTGTMTISGGTLEDNSASDGLGGAVCADSATVNLSGTALLRNNRARNGAAVYVNTGTGVFSGGTVTGNAATDGGAVGVGATSVHLTFSGGVQVTGNTMGTAASNVYLDQDVETVINAAGLGSTARVGVYVPDVPEELFHNRGIASARFGTYTSNANLNKFVNDRSSSLTASGDDSTKNIVWGNPLTVEVRYLAYYTDGLPPGTVGDTGKKKTINNYYPPDGINKISQIADDVFSKNTLNMGTEAAYGGAYADGETDYGEFLTDVNWNSAGDGGKGCWDMVERDGTIASNHKKIIIYYSLPAYLNIENNTGHTLNLSSLQVMGRSVVSGGTEPGYGYVMAVNGATLSALRPITAADMVLQDNMSLKLLFPGGRSKSGKSVSYELKGSFDTTETVPVRRNGGSAEDVTPGGFTLTGNTLTNNATYDIIFGGAKMICRIVDKNGDEHYYSSISAAVTGVGTLDGEGLLAEEKTAEIGMMTDYLMPGTDKVEVPEGYHVTFNTAIGGTRKYSDDPAARATISRDNGNSNSFIKTADYPSSTTPSSLAAFTDDTINSWITVRDLIFDGKDVASNANGGVLNTSKCDVHIENILCRNFTSSNGGAVFVIRGELSIINSQFTNNTCTAKDDKAGGGAVWTTAAIMELTRCTFTNCVCPNIKAQGGGVFHNIRELYGLGSVSRIEDCHFANCHTVAAAGGLETDALDVTVRNCTFSNCYSSNKNAGALNIYTNNNQNLSSLNTYALVENCVFTNCRAGAENGGAIRCLAGETTVQNCTITNCTAVDWGGGIACGVTDKSKHSHARLLTVLGCTIDGCMTTGTSHGYGGGIACNAVQLIIGDYVYTDAEGAEQVRHTIINNCESGSMRGGGVYHARGDTGSFTRITNAIISNCRAATDGGGVFTKSKSVILTGTTIKDCVSRGTESDSSVFGGGGLCSNNSAPVTLDACTITGNTAANYGGGVCVNGNLTLRSGTTITGNRLTTNVADYAAGVYMFNAKLTVGVEGNEFDTITVKDNYTASGARSDLRLKVNSSNENANDSVSVLCGLKGDIYVVNARKQTTWFGTSKTQYPVGLSDNDAVFKADDGTLWGIIDRAESSGKRIIWGGLPVCKITDENGDILYFKNDGSDPAIFDLVDNRNSNRATAFGFLRSPVLYNADGSSYTGTTFYVKMLVETYEQGLFIATPNTKDRTIIFTTETTRYNRDTNPYGYRGRSGTSATIYRGPNLNAGDSLFYASCNVKFQNIILDGGKAANSPGGSLVRAKDNWNITVELGEGAVLQNMTTTGNGGGALMEKGTLRINGGTIRNCTAANGGAAYLNTADRKENNKNVTTIHTFTAGSISQCTSTGPSGDDGDGGGVYVNNGAFAMSGGSITRCGMDGSSFVTRNGGGVFVADGKTLYMTGGSITNCGVREDGGGIAVGGEDARLYFAKRPSVTGNRSEDSVVGSLACNVQLNEDTNGIIRTYDGGLYPGASIGVYVPGDEHPETADESKLSNYDRHGKVEKPFGTYTVDEYGNQDNTKTLYGFINDRNGYKGGLKPGMDDEEIALHYIYWIKVFTLEISKQVSYSENLPPSEIAAIRGQRFHFDVILTGPGADGITGVEFGPMDFKSNYAQYTKADFWIPIEPNPSAETDEERWPAVSISGLPQGLKYDVRETLTSDDVKNRSTLPPPTSGIPAMTGIVGENVDKANVPDTEHYVSRISFTNTFPVCKITDNNGKLLYMEQSYDLPTFNSEGHREQNTEKVPAVFTELSDALEALDESNGPLYSGIEKGANIVYEEYDLSDGCHIEMLVKNYYLPGAVTIGAGQKVTLTTASASAASFPFQGKETETETATIQRKRTSPSMFTVEDGGELTLINITLDGNSGSQSETDGGIVRVRENGSLKIQDGATLQNSITMKNGGAVYVAAHGQVAITGGGKIQGNTSQLSGGAVYVDTDGIMTINEDTSVKRNTIINNKSNGDGAGIYLAEGSTLKLSGNPNFGGAIMSAGNHRNVTYSTKTNGGDLYKTPRQDIFIAGFEGVSGDKNAASLVVTGDITSGEGSIWVWAEKMPHYKAGEQFAEIGSGASFTNKNGTMKAFRNAQFDDVSESERRTLHGMAKESEESEVKKYVYWENVVVCKITDKDGKLLYYMSGENYMDAVYKTLSGAFDDINDNKLYRKLSNGTYEKVDLSANPTPELYVKMLVDNYVVTSTINLNSGRTATLTTASKDDTDGYSLPKTAENIAVISPGSSFKVPLFKTFGDFRLNTITLDGVKGSRTAEADGGLVYVEAGGALDVQADAKLQNSKTNGNGGAVYVAADGTAKVTGGTVQNNEGADGGAVYVAADGTVTISGGTVQDNSSTGSGGAVYVAANGAATISGGTVQSNSTSGMGGAVYVAADGTASLSGGTVSRNTATGGGAGIYLAWNGDDETHGTLNLSGSPNFGTGNLSGTNRQDIFVAGYEGEGEEHYVQSLVVTGYITSGEKSVWVWLEENPHYLPGEQFAKYKDDLNADEDKLNNTIKVFRNANGEDLDAELHEGDTGRNIYWNAVHATRRVVLRKVDASNNRPLAGAVFAVYKGTSTQPMEGMDALTSQSSGIIWIGELSYGDYYMKETEAPSGYASGKWFKIEVGAGGVTISGPQDSDPLHIPGRA